MAAHPKVRFLASDIWDTPEDGNRYEVIDGELYMTPPPVTRHQGGAGQLYGYVWTYLQQHPIGRIFFAPIGLVLDEENGLQPDLVYVSHERKTIITEKGIEGSPDLVVEVLSPSTSARDRGIKMRRYAAAGIPNYWILDPKFGALEPYRLGEQGYELLGAYGTSSTFLPELFPGLEIPVDQLWS